MRKRPTEHEVFERVEITDIAEEGRGVGRAGELVLFVEKAVPGDVVDVELYRKKKNFGEGRIRHIHRFSTHRTDPFCRHFGTCGGCKWQHITYAAQLAFKQKSVTDVLQRVAKIDTSFAEPILASPQNRFYRNKLEFTFSSQRWLTAEDLADGAAAGPGLGFHVPLRFDKVLEITECHLQEDPSNAIRNVVRTFALENEISFYDLRNHHGALRNLIIRTSLSGELMVVVIFAYPSEAEVKGLITHLETQFSEITSLLYCINQKRNDTIFDQEILTWAGRAHIFEAMNDEERQLRYKVGPKSFYQTNPRQAVELYKVARDFAGFRGDELVYDLYTGAGTIANFVASDVKAVVGIETVEAAIEDARENSAFNDIANTTFYAGDMKDILTAEFVSRHGRPDIVITDPPRAGMHADVIARLLEMEAPKIVYVSCNAATQARDIALLKEKYEVTRIRPVDMFPHTQHVENVVLMQIRG